MKIVRMILCVLGLFSFSFFVTAQTAEKSRVFVTTTERVPFNNGVSVHLKDTFGEVLVEGWNRDEIEIELKAGTQKQYTPADHLKEKRRLEKVKLAITNDNAGGLLIETKNMPFMKSNLSLEYKVKVPQSIFLKVKHGIGEVTIKNMTSDIEATVRIGELVVEVPENVRYDIDARAKIGAIESAFIGADNRQRGLGAKLTDETKHSEPHKLYLRIGIGEVDVRKMNAAK